MSKKEELIERKHKLTVYVVVVLLGVLSLASVPIMRSTDRWNSSEDLIALALNIGTELIGAALIFLVLYFFLFDEQIGSGVRHGIDIDDRSSFEVPFQTQFENSKSIDLHDYSLKTITAAYSGFLTKKAQEGCKMRFLLLDPNAEAVNSVEKTTDSGNLLKQDIERSLRILKPLTDIGNVEIRLTSIASPYSLLVVEPEKSYGYVQVELYAFDLPSEDDRPHFSLSKNTNGYWYNFFWDQFEKLWENSSPYTR